MRYTISEMAELLGVTTHMLRHYEKAGIIRPETSEQRRQLERLKVVLQHLKDTKEYYMTLDEKVGAIWTENHPKMWRLNLSDRKALY